MVIFNELCTYDRPLPHTARFSSYYEIMNSELIIIANWFKANRLSLNLEKTNLIIFSSLRKKLSTIKPLYINEIPIVQTRSSKFLGVIVDEHLTWRDHVL